MTASGRFGIVSHSLPPSWSGQSVILEKLLRDVDPGRYVLLSTRAAVDDQASEFIAPLPARTLAIGSGPRLPLARLSMRIDGAFRLSARVAGLVRAARRERLCALVACTGDLLDLPAAWLASRILRIGLVPYLFDDYRTQWTHPAYRAFAERMEPRVMAAASAVVVPNEFLGDEMKRRHGIDARVVRNAVDASRGSGVDRPWPARPGPVRIVYTGAIYHAHFDAFRNLVAAVAGLDRPAEIHLYTTQSPEQLAAEGIRGPVVVHEHLPPDEVREVQHDADVLFLPLAFESDIPDVIRTSAPGKTGEYLLSGRPILVHAPADSFLSDYFRRNGCGFVADVSGADPLRRILVRILDEPSEREDTTKRAVERAETDFSLYAARARLIGAIDAALPGSHR